MMNFRVLIAKCMGSTAPQLSTEAQSKVVQTWRRCIEGCCRAIWTREVEKLYLAIAVEF